MWIKGFANSRNRLYPQGFEHAAQLLVDQIDAAKKMAKLIGLGGSNRRFCIECAAKVVQHGQQFRDQIGSCTIVSFGALPFDSFAKVIKVSLAPRDRIAQLTYLGLHPLKLSPGS